MKGVVVLCSPCLDALLFFLWSSMMFYHSSFECPILSDATALLSLPLSRPVVQGFTMFTYDCHNLDIQPGIYFIWRLYSLNHIPWSPTACVFVLKTASAFMNIQFIINPLALTFRHLSIWEDYIGVSQSEARCSYYRIAPIQSFHIREVRSRD